MSIGTPAKINFVFCADDSTIGVVANPLNTIRNAPRGNALNAPLRRRNWRRSGTPIPKAIEPTKEGGNAMSSLDSVPAKANGSDSRPHGWSKASREKLSKSMKRSWRKRKPAAKQAKGNTTHKRTGRRGLPARKIQLIRKFELQGLTDREISLRAKVSLSSVARYKQPSAGTLKLEPLKVASGPAGIPRVSLLAMQEARRRMYNQVGPGIERYFDTTDLRWLLGYEEMVSMKG